MYHWDRKAYRKKVAWRVGMLIVAVGSVAFVSGKSRSKDLGKAPRLTESASMRIDGRELSAISLAKDSSGAIRVAAVGDSNATLHDAQVSMDLQMTSQGAIEFGQAIVDRFAVCGSTTGMVCKDSLVRITSQWEAMAVDGSGRHFLLQEFSRAIIVMDPALNQVRQVLNFDFSGSSLGPKRRSKRYRNPDDNLSGEGFLLMKSGHILVAKEKSPAILVEFGPAGSAPLGVGQGSLLAAGEAFELPAGDRGSMELLAEWQIAGYGKCDISDLAAGIDGSVYVLSEICGTVQRLQDLKADEKTAVSLETWRLPKRIKHPEGIAVDSAGRFWVVNDTKDQGDNLFVVEPPKLPEQHAAQ
jgi:hypothetical protein